MKKKMLNLDETNYRTFKYLLDADGLSITEVINGLIEDWILENQARIKSKIFRVLADTPDLQARTRPQRQA